MRYGMIMAGGSGTRLWPMSRARLPKQLIGFIRGESLLQIAVRRLAGLVAPQQVYICAGQTHRDAILGHVAGSDPQRYLGEPVGRDTLNAVGFSAAVIAKRDPDATIAVFTADHVIEPVDRFVQIVQVGFDVVDQDPKTLVTFGIKPTEAATSYGYLELGAALEDPPDSSASAIATPRTVSRFKEKPDAPTAGRYLEAGPGRYLWNSGMFVWRASTLLDCIRRYEPQTHEGLMQIADAWGGPRQEAVMASVYPALKKTSIDYAVMERASADDQVCVAAVPMDLTWLDVGSWPAFARTCDQDEQENALAAQRHVLVDSARTVVASNDPDHLIAALGCEDLIIVHTPDATLVCRADRAEDIKKLHEMVGEKYGDQLL